MLYPAGLSLTGEAYIHSLPYRVSDQKGGTVTSGPPFAFLIMPAICGEPQVRLSAANHFLFP